MPQRVISEAIIAPQNVAPQPAAQTALAGEQRRNRLGLAQKTILAAILC